MLEAILNGGFFMIPLMLCSVLSIGVILDRIMAFREDGKIDTRELRAEVLELLQEDKVDEAILLCKGVHGPVAAVLLAGLQSYQMLRTKGESSETIRMVTGKTMEDYAVHAISAVESRFFLLTTIATAAPLLGMAGTVTGMIASFEGLAEASSLASGAVASGIAEALTTTAAGLLIALMAVIPHSFFQARAERIELELEEVNTEVTEFILTHH